MRLLRIPLTVPYKLAIRPVTHFDTLLVRLEVDGREGFGEATILTGYTDETVDECWDRGRATAQTIAGMESASAKEVISERLTGAPFTATALRTAIEMAEGHPLLQLDERAEVPLLAGINATLEDEIAAEMDRALEAGFTTLKLKIGFDVESDIRRIRFIQRHNAGRARLRIDANQGYNCADACRFASATDPTDIELLEQPCSAHDWESLETVAKRSPIPLMLDESIYGEADIDRAAELGARFVKLKLMKCGSLDNLASGLERIREHGMEPVLGNGVAGDIGCWMEACVARRHIRNAGEMNGFLRQATPLARPPLRVHGGSVVLEPGGAPYLDPDAIGSVTVKATSFERGGPQELRAR